MIKTKTSKLSHYNFLENTENGCHGQPVARVEANLCLEITNIAKKAATVAVTRATGCPWHPSFVHCNAIIDGETT